MTTNDYGQGYQVDIRIKIGMLSSDRGNDLDKLLIAEANPDGLFHGSTGLRNISRLHSRFQPQGDPHVVYLYIL